MDEVTLRVRAYGQQGVEFALIRPEFKACRVSSTWWLMTALLFGSGGLLLPNIHGVYSWLMLISGLVLAALVVWIFQATGAVVIEESMLVVPSLGVKLSQRRRNGKVTSRFVDLEKICGVAVNEAITFSNVVYSLVLMVEGENKMVLPYQTFRPRVAVLQEIYGETKKLLFPDDSWRKMHLPDEIAPAQTC